MQIKNMLGVHPSGDTSRNLVECIAACFECAQARTTCAEACDSLTGTPA